MLTRKTIGFIGAGNMAEALVKGLLASGSVTPGRIIASDRVSERLVKMAERYEMEVFNSNVEVARRAEVVMLCVKPQDAASALTEVAPHLGVEKKLLISIVAGLTTKRIFELLQGAGSKTPPAIVRAMPNTPAIVRQGAIGLCAGPGASDEELGLTTLVFEAIGRVSLVEDEALMDVVTGLSGSGPAYVFLIMRSMAEAGEALGLSKEAAKTLSIQTVLGAAGLASESELSLDELIKMVTSPGGTTIEGLKILEQADLAGVLRGAIEAATKRSQELSKG